MYDPNDVVDIEVEGFGKLKSRLLTERQVKEVKRLTADARGEGKDLVGRHEAVNAALAVGLVDFNPEDFTLVQKLDLAETYPWEVTMGELNRLKNQSASQSA
jgi:hypothetical protein